MGRGSSKAGGGGGGKTTILNFEKSIYQNNTESAMIVTANGEVITFNDNEEHRVFGTEDDIKKMEGGTATHNHPNNAIFSNTDMRNGIVSGNLKEMRIVTKNGETHSLTNKSATKEQRIKLNTEYQNKMMKARNNVNAKRRRGETVNTDEYINNFMSNWLTNNASDYGFEYKKGKVR